MGVVPLACGPGRASTAGHVVNNIFASRSSVSCGRTNTPNLAEAATQLVLQQTELLTEAYSSQWDQFRKDLESPRSYTLLTLVALGLALPVGMEPSESGTFTLANRVSRHA